MENKRIVHAKKQNIIIFFSRKSELCRENDFIRNVVKSCSHNIFFFFLKKELAQWGS